MGCMVVKNVSQKKEKTPMSPPPTNHPSILKAKKEKNAYLDDLGVGLVRGRQGDGVEHHHLLQLRLEDTLVGRPGEEPVRREGVHAPGCWGLVRAVASGDEIRLD